MSLSTTNIRISDVATALGCSTKLTVCCTSDKINAWARYKPYRGLNSGDWSAQKYGMLDASNADGTRYWYWAKPRGKNSSYNEPYRLGDFRGYEHNGNAQETFYVKGACDADYIPCDGKTSVVVKMKRSALSSTSSRSSNILYLKAKSASGYNAATCISNADLFTGDLKGYIYPFYALKRGNSWLAYPLSGSKGDYSASFTIGAASTSETMIAQIGMASTEVTDLSHAMPNNWGAMACTRPYINLTMQLYDVFYEATFSKNSTGVQIYFDYVTSKKDSKGYSWGIYQLKGFKCGIVVTPKTLFDQDYDYYLSCILGNASSGEYVKTATYSQGTSTNYDPDKASGGGWNFCSETKNGSHEEGKGQYTISNESVWTSATGGFLYIRSGVSWKCYVGATVVAKQNNTVISESTSLYRGEFAAMKNGQYMNL